MRSIGYAIATVSSIVAANPGRAHHGGHHHHHHHIHTGPMYTVASAEPLVECPVGYELEDSRCVARTFEPLVPVCREGVLQMDDTCLVATMLIAECPLGFTKVGNSCRRTMTVPSQITCPPDFVLDFEETAHHKSTSVCLRTSTERVFGCPADTVQVGQDCIMEISAPAQLSCPMGSERRGTSCVIIEEFDCQPQVISASAASGHHHHHHHRRLEQVEEEQAVEQAPVRELNSKPMHHLHGHTHGHVHAQFVEPVTAKMVTVPAMVTKQVCERTKTVPVDAFCEEGKLVGHECITAVVLPLIELKPIVTVERTAPLSSCPIGFEACGSGVKHGRHASAGSTDCCASEEIEPIHSCPKGYMRMGKSCEKIVPADYVCRGSSSLARRVGDRCEVTHYVEPTMSYITQMQCQGLGCPYGGVQTVSGHSNRGCGHSCGHH